MSQPITLPCAGNRRPTDASIPGITIIMRRVKTGNEQFTDLLKRLRSNNQIERQKAVQQALRMPGIVRLIETIESTYTHALHEDIKVKSLAILTALAPERAEKLAVL